MSTGVNIRMARLVPPGGEPYLVLPIDHGLTCGAMPGIEFVERLVSDPLSDFINAIVLHKGIVTGVLPPSAFAKIPFLVQLSGSTTMGQAKTKVLVSSVQEASRLGAYGVAVHVNLGTHDDTEMLKALGHTVENAHRLGLPVLAMLYPEQRNDDNIAHAGRVGVELGADIVKIPLPQDVSVFPAIRAGGTTPVLVAGGEALSSFRDCVAECIRAVEGGASGVVVGRNVFGRQQPHVAARVLHASLKQHRWAESERFDESALQLTVKSSF